MSQNKTVSKESSVKVLLNQIHFGVGVGVDYNGDVDDDLDDDLDYSGGGVGSGWVRGEWDCP